MSSFPRWSRRWLQIAIGVGLSAVFLTIALRGVDWSEVGKSFATADYRWVPVMVVLGVYVLYVRSQRWKLLLDQATGRQLPMQPVFSANAIGFMANMLLPLRAGEIARPLLLSRRAGIPFATVLATAVVERILDLVALVCSAMWVVSVSPVPPEVTGALWSAGVLMIVMVVGLFVLHVQRARLLPIIDRIWGLLPARLAERVVEMEHRFLDDMATIGDPGVLARAMLWSFYIWLLIAIGFALGFLITDLDIPFLSGGITVMTFVALAVAAPAAPGFVGSFQFACKVALVEIGGTSAAAALGYSIIVHATQFSTQVALGLVYLLREGVSLGDIGRMEAPETAERP